jgi:hypothetical protein
MIDRKIIALKNREIVLAAGKSYKEKINARKTQEKHMIIEKMKKPELMKEQTPIRKGKERSPKKESNEISELTEAEPTEVEIVEKENDLGFRKGIKPKSMKTRYQERKEGVELNKSELRGNTAYNFLAHNVNAGKWWNDPQIRNEDWVTSGKRLTDYILTNEQRTMQQLEERRTKNPAKAMNTIRRVMMQINQTNRNDKTDIEYLITQYKGYLSIEALKLEAPIGGLKTLRESMKTIEESFVRSDEYLLIKAEILVKAKEWKEATMAINGMSKNGELMKEKWMDRISILQGLINENDQKERRNRLVSYSNVISKNHFENDEDINKATRLMWNRKYQEAIDAAYRIWTKNMIISKSELIFAKTKVLQIMIECMLNITLSDTTEAEDWLDIVKKLDYNGIMTVILDLKMMIRKGAEKEFIGKQFNDTLRRIGIIEDSIERNDWYSQMQDLKDYYR